MSKYRDTLTVAQKRFPMQEGAPPRDDEPCTFCDLGDEVCRRCGKPAEFPQKIGIAKMATTQPMPIALLEWRAVKRATLRGFATVRVGKALKISDIPVHSGGGKRWASLPMRPQIDRDGTAIKDDAGKIKYAKIIEWLDKETADKFSESVIMAVEAAHQGDTNAD